MESQNNAQLELFSQTKALNNAKDLKKGNPFLARIRNYEKTILIIISLALTGIVSFSLGVEKGKRVSIATQAADKLAPKSEVLKQPEAPQKQNYIIQLASYKTRMHAQKEVELLKKRGLSPLVLSKGSYTVLCVGNLSNRETAQSLLSELKKRYKDCYIRRL
jgi:hypothetical protein